MTVQVASDNSASVTADCGAQSHAVGGGGSSTTQDLTDSYPSGNNGALLADGTENPRYWTAVFAAATTGNANKAYAICVPD